MTCSSCGTATRPGARFCEECGARLDAVCPACGARVSPGKKFCADCGARVDAGARPDAEPLPAPSRARFSSEDDPRAVAPAGYTPQHLAERILKDRATLQGERKQVTVFFADVSGFTSLAEALDPEEVHALWMDSASEDSLEELINGLAGEAILLMLTWRPSYRPRFSEHTYITRLVLEPLDDADAHQLVRATLGIEDLPDDLATIIARKAEGNPFFLEEIGRALVESGACLHTAMCLTELGDHEAALELIRRAERVAAAADHLYTTMQVQGLQAEVLIPSGRAAEAIPLLEEAARVCREKHFLGQLINSLRLLGHAYVLVGRPADAIPLVEESIALQEKAKVYVVRGSQHNTLAMAALQLGDLDRAEAELRTASGFAERCGERASQGWANLTWAELAVRRSERDAARRHLDRALGIADELGMRPLAERCRERLAALA